MCVVAAAVVVVAVAVVAVAVVAVAAHRSREWFSVSFAQAANAQSDLCAQSKADQTNRWS